MTDLRSLVAEARYEVIPLKNLEAQLPHIPKGASVSVTCSFAKGQQTTLDLTRRIIDLGHMAVPHFSARLTADESAVRDLDDVLECYLMAGEADFLLKIVAETWDDYQRFLTTRLTSAPNVSHVKSMMVFRTAKQTPGVPISTE